MGTGGERLKIWGRDAWKAWMQ
eukprot:COSAG03_NODE_13400_length_504_cov_1.533333_1_plen_21_part_10